MPARIGAVLVLLAAVLAIAAVVAWAGYAIRRVRWNKAARSSHKPAAASAWAITIAFAAAAPAACFLGIRPSIIRTKQLVDCQNLQAWAISLSMYRQANGRYPATLMSTVILGAPKRYEANAWGHILRYESDGQRYVLASLGADGKEDTPGYLHLLFTSPHASKLAPAERILGNAPADQVVTERGFEQSVCN